MKRFDEELAATEAVEKQVKDANLRLATLSAKEASLRDAYGVHFERSFATRPALSQHPFFTDGVRDRVCGLCGAAGEDVVHGLQRH